MPSSTAAASISTSLVASAPDDAGAAADVDGADDEPAADVDD